jgi:hypothetical protein
MNGVTLGSGAGLSHARTTKSSYSDNSGNNGNSRKENTAYSSIEP